MRKENYQYQCLITGTIKAYKSMTRSAARAANEVLACQGSDAHWVARAEPKEAWVAAPQIQLSLATGDETGGVARRVAYPALTSAG